MARPKSKESKSRLSLELPLSVREDLEGIRDFTRADSLSEAVRRAIEVYELVLTARAAGNSVYVQDRETGERTEVVIL